eukprot:COSAG03_NODE_33_length_18025_cov_70.016903_8_plen_1053_part_00
MADDSGDEFLRLEAEAADDVVAPQPAPLPLPPPRPQPAPLPLPLPPPRPPGRPLRQAGMLPKAMPAEAGRAKPATRARPADGTSAARLESNQRLERLAQSTRTSADRDLWDEQRRGSRSAQEALREQQRRESEGRVEFLRNLRKVNELGRSSVDFKQVAQGNAALCTADEHERAEQDRAQQHEKKWRERETKVLRTALRNASPRIDSVDGRGLEDLSQPITASNTAWRTQKKAEKHAEILRGFVHKEQVDVKGVVDRLYTPTVVKRKQAKGVSDARVWQLSIRADRGSNADEPSVLVNSNELQPSFRPETASRLHLQASKLRKKRELDAKQRRPEETFSPAIPSTSRKLATASERSGTPLRRSRSVPVRSATPLRMSSPGRSPTRTSQTPVRSPNFGPRRPSDIPDEVAKAACYCATWVACHGDEFEEVIKQKNRGKKEWSFLGDKDSNAYAYYQRRITYERGLARGARRPITVRAAPQQQVRGGSKREGGRDDELSDLVDAAQRAKSARLSGSPDTGDASAVQPPSPSARRSAADHRINRSPSTGGQRQRRSISTAKRRAQDSDLEQQARAQRMSERPWRAVNSTSSATSKKRSPKVSPRGQESKLTTSEAEMKLAALLARKKAAIAAENFEEAALIKRRQDALVASMPDLSKMLSAKALVQESTAVDSTDRTQNLMQITLTGAASNATVAQLESPELESGLQPKNCLKAAADSELESRLEPAAVAWTAPACEPKQDADPGSWNRDLDSMSEPEPELDPKPGSEQQLEPEQEDDIDRDADSDELRPDAASPAQTVEDPAQRLALLAPAVADKARLKTSPQTLSGGMLAPPRPATSTRPVTAQPLARHTCTESANAEARVTAQIDGSAASQQSEDANPSEEDSQALFSRWKEKDTDFARGSEAIEAKLQAPSTDSNEDFYNGDRDETSADGQQEVPEEAQEEEHEEAQAQENEEHTEVDAATGEAVEDDIDDAGAGGGEGDANNDGDNHMGGGGDMDLDHDWLAAPSDDGSDDPFADMDDILATAAEVEPSDGEDDSEDDFAKLEALLDGES